MEGDRQVVRYVEYYNLDVIISVGYRVKSLAETIAWVVGLGIILDGIGQWVKVFVVNKVEKRFVKLHDRLKEVQDITWEEVK